MPDLASESLLLQASKVRGSRRFEQLGVPVCTKVLEATMDDVQSSSNSVGATLLVDINPGAGDLLLAWLKKAAGSTIPAYYYACAENGTHVEALSERAVAECTEAIMSGNMVIPGIPKPEQFKFEDEPPRKPSLKTLVWDDTEKIAKVPQDKLPGLLRRLIQQQCTPWLWKLICEELIFHGLVGTVHIDTAFLRLLLAHARTEMVDSICPLSMTPAEGVHVCLYVPGTNVPAE